MKQRLQQLLDLPNSVNQKISGTKVNAEIDKFDSNEGIRSYAKTSYTWAALISLIAMEATILKAAYTYFTTDTGGIIAKIGSVLTTLLLVASAFPIAQLIRTRGESLGSSHSGMIGFLFGDFIKTNIRLLGEIAAIGALFAALNQTLGFVLDQNLFNAQSTSLMDVFTPIYSTPINVLNEILKTLNLNTISDLLHSASSFHVDTTGTYNGDFMWSTQDLLGVLGSYVNIIIGLAFMYVNLAIYGFLYNVMASLIKWVSAPSIPLSIKNK